MDSPLSKHRTGFEILIEQLKDGKWIHTSGIGGSILFSSELTSESSKESSSTEAKVYEGSFQVKFHKGINIYRLRMSYPTQITSEEFQLVSSVSNDDGSLWIMDDVIYLDTVEPYEVLDKVGATVLKNESKTIDISNLPTGHYYLYTKQATRPFDK